MWKKFQKKIKILEKRKKFLETIIALKLKYAANLLLIRPTYDARVV